MGENEVNEESEIRHLPDSAKQTLSKLLDKEGVYSYKGLTGIQQEWKTLMASIPEFMPVTEENLVTGRRKYRAEHIRLIEEESSRRGVPGFQLLIGEWGTSGRKRPTVKDLLALLTALDMRRASAYVNEELLKREAEGDAPEMEIMNAMMNLEAFAPKSPDLKKDVQDAVLRILQEEDAVDGVLTHTNTPLDLRPDILQRITNDYDERPVEGGGRKIHGNSSTGQVFVGIIPDRVDDDLLHKLRIRSLRYQPYRLEDNLTRVAVKRLKLGPSDEQSSKMFDTEVKGLRRLEHPNIISLLGYSIDREYGNLVYPLMIGGSLEARLRCKETEIPIPWEVRVDVLLDVAKGLEYLHTQKTPQGFVLVHRDIKPANILLDENMNAKISDFGLLRDGDSGFSRTVVMTAIPAGTNVYMPNEAFRGVVEPSWDIYSFGVVMLETLTGLPSIDENRKPLFTHFDDGDLISDLLDKKAGDWPTVVVERIFALSRQCLAEKRCRPVASALVEEIEKTVTRAPIELDYDYLKNTTNDFDDKEASEGGRFLGAGGYGVVYVGKVAYQPDEDLKITLLRRNAARALGVTNSQLIRIAVKRYTKNKMVTDLEKKFMEEVDAMSRFNHPHLLNLLGYCTPSLEDQKKGPFSFEEHCLVYPLMVNGSLEDRLECKDRTPPIPWKTRVRILKEVCSGIKYLHTFSDRPLIHRDIKSANVLLDEHFSAKIGDFGLVRDGASGVTAMVLHPMTSKIVGTTMYMAEEAIRGEITAKADVFSFGAVILEVVTGLIASPTNAVGEITIYQGNRHDILKLVTPDPKAGEWPDDLVSGLLNLAVQALLAKQQRPTSTVLFIDLSSLVDYWLGGVAV